MAGFETRARRLWVLGSAGRAAAALGGLTFLLLFTVSGCTSTVDEGGAVGGRDTVVADTDVAAPLPVVACEEDSDCGTFAAELGPCQLAVCDAVDRLCVAAPGNDGAACTADDPCVQGAVCQGGVCGGGERTDCDDGNPCTDDFCAAGGGCKHVEREGSCDDGDLCTTGDTCERGRCVGEPLACDDEDPCTVDACDPATGECAAEPLPCDDDDPCTEDTCDSERGCVHEELGTCACQGPDAACDDGVACTAAYCADDGECAWETDACPCTPEDTAACDDGDPCTVESCPAFECVSEASTDGTACDDGDPCTTGEVCQAGVCGGGAPSCGERPCDDGVDNDLDGITDCDDPDCGSEPACAELDCADGVDNDSDGTTDCADLDCAESLDCFRTCTPTTTESVCGRTVSASTFGAADQISFHPACSPQRTGGGEFIYQFRPEADALLSVEFVEAREELDLYVLAGTCDTASCVAWGDDAVEYDLVAGETYFLVVDGRDAAAGDFDVSFRCGAAERCDDGIDNDTDGLTDCHDDECWTAPVCTPEDCGDGVDNDGDGAADCADEDCAAAPECTEDCGDGVDNDGDGAVDCDDGDCRWEALCNATCLAYEAIECDSSVAGSTANLPNQIRWYPGCTSVELGGGERVYSLMPSENVNVTVELSSDDPRLDLVLLGPGLCNAFSCRGAADAVLGDELSAWQLYYVVVDGPQDVAGDFELSVRCGLSETVCDDGQDDDGDGAVDCDDDDCLGTAACGEYLCADGADDDGDGLVDCADPDCAAAPECQVELCTGGVDEDRDGFVDCIDDDCWGEAECACVATDALGCNDRVTVTTSGESDQVQRWGCGPFQITDGPERIFTFMPSASARYVVRLDAAPQVDLFLLAGDCRPDTCVAYGDDELAFDGEAGTRYYIVADAAEGWDGDITVAVDCGDAPEVVCDDGADDDEDGLVDCADPDCSSAPACRTYCSATAVPIGCGQRAARSNEGREGNFSTYSCAGWAEPAGEVVFRFVPEVDDRIVVTLTHDDSIDLDLFLLDQSCDAGECLDALVGGDSLDTTVYGNHLYYLVVDGYQTAEGPSEGQFLLELACTLGGTTESDCADGLDDDGDGDVDCADSDCLADGNCSGALCLADDFVTCGLPVVGSTATRASVMFDYPCAAGSFDGGEAVHRFVPRNSGAAQVRLVSGGEAVDVLVLEDGCGSERCIAAGDDVAAFDAVADRTYFIVVDSLFAGASYELVVDCP